jgi:hypothetical protein
MTFSVNEIVSGLSAIKNSILFDRVLFLRYLNNVGHVPQGIFRHTSLTDFLLKSEVVISFSIIPTSFNKQLLFSLTKF